MNLYLVDKSAYEMVKRCQEAREALHSLVAVNGAIAMCEMIALELLYSARNTRDYERLRESYERLPWLETDNRAMRRAIEVQHELVRKGQHRRALPDLVIAATAELYGATVVHYDKDYDLIADITGQPTMWVVPAGTL
ncbi:PIN domain nuclease [Nocardiopsis dassonvillei]|uniref:PIN domain nuclease n=1 Tax=Nocardiopsis dassonvillei TaxID=2014 RepID=UPI00200DCC19|nr:PIN domain nuclease [Nocardiopsis dassonvillei]MCK9872167.1 PIN domain nuclease [Nocardiopsis dassonvillei]